MQPKYKYKARSSDRFLGTVANHMRRLLDLYWIANTNSFFFIDRDGGQVDRIWHTNSATRCGLYRELWEYAEPRVIEAVAKHRDPSISPNA